jgi:hypothetical protein
MPRWRHSGAPLAFVGYVLLRDGNDPYGLKDVEELWVGGEIRYGFGWLHRVQWEDSVRDCFGISLNLSQNDPILSVLELYGLMSRRIVIVKPQEHGRSFSDGIEILLIAELPAIYVGHQAHG